jgi:acyl-[acyl-carrier-protein] desaturase
MSEICPLVVPSLEKELWLLYRDFFDKAERRRRWSITNDIPWDRCNPQLAPEVADVVESFCAVELYLPDYTAKILPVVRPSRGRAWFYANWGYEESKHSLVLHDWLLRSGHRSDEQMAKLEGMIFEREWNLPHESALGMMVYAMTQELATWLNYRNLNRVVGERGGDAALSQLMTFLAVDERAHYSFFLECVRLFLKHDRPGTLEQMRSVMNQFAMPAIHDLVDGDRRVAAIKSLKLFDEDTYYQEVYLPLLSTLGVDRSEMRNRVSRRKSAPELPVE